MLGWYPCTKFIYSFKACLLTLRKSISKNAACRLSKQGSTLKTLFEEGCDSLAEQRRGSHRLVVLPRLEAGVQSLARKEMELVETMAVP